MDYNLKVILLLIIIIIILFVIFNWKNRWVFYYSFQFPEGTALPFIGGSLKFIQAMNKDLYEAIEQMCKNRPPIFKTWVANELYIINSQPEDVEVLVNTCLEKGSFYKTWHDYIDNTLISSPVSIWKDRRREVNRTFNSKIIASFHDVFIKHSRDLVEKLESVCGQEQTDLLPQIWRSNLDTIFESLFDIDPDLIENRYDIITTVMRAEEILMERIKKFWLLNDFFFRLTDLYKEIKSIAAVAANVCRKTISLKKEQLKAGEACEDDLRRRYFLNHFVRESSKIAEPELIQETLTMSIGSTETTSIVILHVILTLSLHSEIQEKVYQEVRSVFHNDRISLEDVPRLDYLDRVIKETMRILPVFPVILRSIDKDLKIGSLVYPAGSTLTIPLAFLHRRPDLWPDPLKFDPDRFLPEQVAKRHRCAFIPFSFGPRNCIGLKYAMDSMKVVLAHIVKNFQMKAVNYHSLEDLEFEWHLFARPKGYRVVFEKRTEG